MTEAFLLGHLAAFLVTPAWIGVAKNKFSQNVRDQGPARHKQKEGTPTMGGVALFVAFLFTLPMIAGISKPRALLLFSFFAFLALGFVDDWLNMKKTAALGLPARYKLVAQTVLSLLIAVFAYSDGTFPVPFSSSRLTLPFVPAILFSSLVIIATVNAVNLSDGLDGLAAGLLSIAFAALAWKTRPGHLTSALFLLSGVCSGFLWLNFYPARIFLGNTGAMGLGGALATAALLTGTALYLPLIGMMFVLEALSVIVQVASFRLTGKRVFKMSPVHHHFELKGLPEPGITVRFWLFAILFCLIALP